MLRMLMAGLVGAAAAPILAFVATAIAAPQVAAQPPISEFSVAPTGSITFPAGAMITVTGTVECEPGEVALLVFAVEQRSALGDIATSGVLGAQQCSGGVDSWRLTAPAHENARAGQASLAAAAIVGNAVRLVSDDHFVLIPDGPVFPPASGPNLGTTVEMSAPPVSAAGSIVTVQAKVRDANGLPIEGATVIFLSTSGSITTVATSAGDGVATAAWNGNFGASPDVTLSAAARGVLGSTVVRRLPDDSEAALQAPSLPFDASR